MLMALAMMTSCTGYKRCFDCPPAVGVGCKSVSEVEGMILEREKGEDLFLAGLESKGKCRDCTKSRTSAVDEEDGEVVIHKKDLLKRIWIRGTSTSAGNHLDDHHVYFTVPSTSTQRFDIAEGRKLFEREPAADRRSL